MPKTARGSNFFKWCSKILNTEHYSIIKFSGFWASCKADKKDYHLSSEPETEFRAYMERYTKDVTIAVQESIEKYLQNVNNHYLVAAKHREK